LAMEPPVRDDAESLRDEKAKVLKAIPALTAKDVVRAQFKGYRAEKGVAADSTTETFPVLNLETRSWRGQGVPFYIRAGKCLPVTCTEALVRLRRPPSVYPEVPLTQNHMRLRISPDVAIATGMMSLAPGEEGAVQSGEMIASRHP